MDKQYGGLKWTGPDNPIEEDTDNREITIKNTMFNPVYNMVNRVDTQLSLLTANSLKGFMINLNVTENDTEYKNLDKDGAFTVPVTNFILKFVVFRGTSNPDSLESYNGIHKSFESRQSFFNESKLQQYIWTQSIIYGRPAICPSVANLSMFDTVNSKNLMQIFLDKVNSEPTATLIEPNTTLIEPNTTSIEPTTTSIEPTTTSIEPTATSIEPTTTSIESNTTSIEPTTTYIKPTTTSTFEYLQKYSTINGRGIGVLTMPSITQSTTLDRFLTLPDDSDFYGEKLTHEMKSRAISSIFAQIARLFIDIGVLHLDLHLENIIIYLDSDKKILDPVNKIKTLLIDFGRASNIENSEKDVLGIKDKITANGIKNVLYDRFDKMGCSTPADEKGKYIENVLDTIAKVDFSINQLHYKDKRTYQMMWYEQYRHYYKHKNSEVRREYAILFVNAFDILKDMMKANIKNPSIDPPTINEYERDGSFVNFNDSIDKFIVSNPGPIHTGESVHQMQYRVYPPPAPSASNESSLVKADRTKRQFEQVEQSTDADADPQDTKRNRPNVGGRKNKHHKTNKRKNCKSKRNRRNKTKNTRKKRKN